MTAPPANGRAAELDRGRAHLGIALARFASGQLDDELIVTVRRWVVEGRVDAAILSLATAVVTGGARLPDELIVSLLDLFDSDELRTALLAHAVPAETPIASRHETVPAEEGERHTAIVTALAAHDDGVLAVWCASRRPPFGAPLPPARAAWVVEADPTADLVHLTDVFQRALGDGGVGLPIVEVRHAGTPPTGAEAAVVDVGDIVWNRFGDRELRLARVFDAGVDGRGEFADDHALLDGEERRRLLAYLGGGTPVMSMWSNHTDVVAKTAGEVVPIDLVTDGRWIWSEATRYYLDRHRLAPPEPFLSYLRSVERGVPHAVDEHTLRRALGAVSAHDAPSV